MKKKQLRFGKNEICFGKKGVKKDISDVFFSPFLILMSFFDSSL